MSLKEELDAFRANFTNKLLPEVSEEMERAHRDLSTSEILQNTVKSGDKAPDFNLPDARGGYVHLYDLLTRGPVVISFYRGGWCPYCKLELRALQQVLPAITALGAELVAISPQKPDESLSTAEKNQLSFPVLSDVGSATAKDFGIVFDAAKWIRIYYASAGHSLPKVNGDDSWVLPIPATFVVKSSGIVELAFVDVDYRNRLEPAEIITALRKLVGELDATLS
jgi:peroxiredoxin